MFLFSRGAMLFRHLFHRNRREAELQEELNAYIEELSDEKVQQGMAPAEGRRAALVEMGGLEQVKEACRDGWSFVWLDSFAADIRYGFRNMLRVPGFYFIVVATIGLALGLNTALFTVFGGLRSTAVADSGSQKPLRNYLEE